MREVSTKRPASPRVSSSTGARRVRGADLRPAIVVKDKEGKVLKLRTGGEARYFLSVDAILSVETAPR